MTRRSILFAAGGSGGHLFPAIAVAEELLLRDPGLRLGIVASDKEIDRSILSQFPFERYHLAAVSPSRLLRQPVKVVRENWQAWKAALLLVREQSPAVVVGCGGFASVPLVWAAIRSLIPVVLLEQNLIPGRANVWLSRWAHRICLSFDETTAFLPSSVQRRASAICVTGNPIRHGMQPTLHESKRQPKQLLVLGGSQGARHLNAAVAQWVTSKPDSLHGWHVIHQTGTADQAAIAQKYSPLNGALTAEAVSFIAEPGRLYRSATLVITRAGATTLAELASLATPTITVPLPTAARDHQTANARWYAEHGAARVVIQAERPDQTAQQLSEEVTPLLSSAARRDELSQAISLVARRAAATEVAGQILQVSRPETGQISS